MGQKNNIRSIRFSDELAKLINQQDIKNAQRSFKIVEWRAKVIEEMAKKDGQ